MPSINWSRNNEVYHICRFETFWKWQKNCTYLIVLSSPPLKIMSLLYHKQRFEFPVRPSMMRGSTSNRTHLNWKIQLYISNNHHKTDNIQKIYNWLKIFCMNQNKICHKLDVIWDLPYHRLLSFCPLVLLWAFSCDILFETDFNF